MNNLRSSRRVIGEEKKLAKRENCTSITLTHCYGFYQKYVLFQVQKNNVSYLKFWIVILAIWWWTEYMYCKVLKNFEKYKTCCKRPFCAPFKMSIKTKWTSLKTPLNCIFYPSQNKFCFFWKQFWVVCVYQQQDSWSPIFQGWWPAFWPQEGSQKSHSIVFLLHIWWSWWMK